MGIEIEKKFLVTSNDFKTNAVAFKCKQGYIFKSESALVRVRMMGERGFLTIKGKNVNITRPEYEWEIPVAEATEILESLCQKPLIEKTRYILEVNTTKWEVDVFWGENEGLIVAEVELKTEDQNFNQPDWLGKEVSTDTKYFNSNLVEHPFKQWKMEDNHE